MGVDVMFVLPKPAARTNGKSLHAEELHRSSRLEQTRSAVTAATVGEVLHAVEQAAAHAAAAVAAGDRPAEEAPRQDSPVQVASLGPAEITGGGEGLPTSQVQREYIDESRVVEHAEEQRPAACDFCARGCDAHALHDAGGNISGWWWRKCIW